MIKNKQIRIIFNEENYGFAKGNNIGISQAKGEYILLLNNDTIVTRGWIGGMLRHLRVSTVGMVGPVTNNIGNEAMINVTFEKFDNIDSFAEAYTISHWNETMGMTSLAMFCVIIKKEVLNKIGLLDERFGLGSFEDDDFALRLRNSGYKLLCLDDVFIHHFGNASFMKLGDGKYLEIMMKNMEYYNQKWKTKWSGHHFRQGILKEVPGETYEYIMRFYKDYLKIKEERRKRR